MCHMSSGRYLEDEHNAQIVGPCVPLGFSNKSFFRALDKQPRHGSVFFDAFVIGKEVKTIEHINAEVEEEQKNYT